MIGWFGGAGETILKNCANVGCVAGSKLAAGLICYASGSNWRLEGCASFGALIHGDKSSSASVVASLIAAPQSVTDMVVLPVVDDATDASIAKTAKTLEEALEWVNATYGEQVGAFVLNSDENAMVLAQPKLVALQQAADAGKAGDVRFVALLSDCLRYSTVGFEITVEGGSMTKLETSFVHRKLIYSSAEGTQELAAQAFGGTYLYAVEAEGLIPTEGTVTVTVRPYALEAEGETVYCGESYLVTFTNGALISVVESK